MEDKMNRYVVDRFENEIVICEDKNGNMIKIDKCLLQQISKKDQLLIIIMEYIL